MQLLTRPLSFIGEPILGGLERKLELDLNLNYFDHRMRLIRVPVDPVTHRADVKAMKKAITKNTCLVRRILQNFLFQSELYQTLDYVAISVRSWFSTRSLRPCWRNCCARTEIRYPSSCRCLSWRICDCFHGRSRISSSTFRF